MGNPLTEEGEQTRRTSKTPYGDLFDKLLPQYMAMGMTYEQFWDGEIGIHKAYREAYKLRMENELRIADRNGWYIGQYIVHALRSVQLLAVAVPVKKIPDPKEYPEKPFLIQAEEEERKNKDEEVRKKREEDQSKLAMSMFQQMVARMNGNIIRRVERQKQDVTGQ